MKIYNRIDETIGNTPLLRLNKMLPADAAEVLVKLEYFNPSSSVKDRIALNMIEQAEKDGNILPGGTIVEPTSGNTGIGLCMIAAVKGYKIIIVMPETMSKERQSMMKHLGAELILTPGALGMKGAIQKAEEILASNPNSFMPDQFNNPANEQAHYQTTGPEIWSACDGKIDIFIAAVGTGGTLSGSGAFLKGKKPGIKVIAVEPEKSHVLSGGTPAPHGIQGIGAGFVPGNYNEELVDEIIQIKDEDAIQAARDAAAKEGILCGISSGANLHATMLVAQRPENKGKRIVTIICDTAERYLSTSLFEKQ